MIVTRTTVEDIPKIVEIYDNARKFMVQTGNPNQWDGTYPSAETVMSDIENGVGYVIKDGDEICGVFAFIIGEEPTYKVIENGAWRFDDAYGTIHRIASSGTHSRVAECCFEFCLSQINHLRIDTHKDNVPMQNAVTRFGFKECGIIYVRNGARIAYDFKRSQ